MSGALKKAFAHISCEREHKLFSFKNTAKHKCYNMNKKGEENYVTVEQKDTKLNTLSFCFAPQGRSFHWLFSVHASIETLALSTCK